MGGQLVRVPPPLQLGEPSISSSFLVNDAPTTEKSDVWLLSNGRVSEGPPSGVTPDHSCAIIIGVRPSTGMLSTSSDEITSPTEPEDDSSRGASAVTVTFSETA